MSSPFDSPANPYRSPSQQGIASGRRSRQLPLFPKVLFITDLCFCLIRIPLVALGLFGYLSLRGEDPNSPLLASVMMELLTGAGIAVTGLPGNAAMLARRSWGVPLGWMCVLATFGSFLVGLWQVWLTVGLRAEPGTPEFIGFVIGGSFVAIIRLSLLGLYVAALVKFASWNRGASPAG